MRSRTCLVSQRRRQKRRLSVERCEARNLLAAAPVAFGDFAFTLPDTPVTISHVLLNDTDADGDVLRLDGFVGVDGSVTDHGDGRFTYTPPASFVGRQEFQYVVSDGDQSDSAVVSVFVNEVIDEAEARAAILDGVTDIGGPGSPGEVAALEGTAFAVMLAEGNEPMVAAASWGNGRVAIMGHSSYEDFDNYGDVADTGILYENLVSWLGKNDSDPKSLRIVTNETGTESWLESRGYTNVVRVSSWTRSLGSADVALVDVSRTIGDADRAAVENFVTDGGGIFLAGTGWGWAQSADLKTLPVNEMVRRAGLGFPNGTRPNQSDATTRATALSNANNALNVWANPNAYTTQQQEEAAEAIDKALEVLPAQDPLLHRINAAFTETAAQVSPTPQTPVSDPFLQTVLEWESENLQNQPAEEVSVHRTASTFGLVDDSVPRVEKTLVIEATVSDRRVWYSTGLYAAPGELVTVTTPATLVNRDVRIQVGSHDDPINGRSSWQRMPRIDRRFDIQGAETPIANAFGGLIYVAIPSGFDAGTFEVTIDGAVEAPTFRLGETTDEQWIASIRDRAVPYAELISDGLIISLRSDDIRSLDNPTELMTYWNDIVTFQDELAGLPDPRTYPERIDLDVQISNGYLHAGYPIAGPDSTGDTLVDLDKLRAEGTWGYFHELGHNHQEGEWTFSGGGEVTVNIFTMYAYDRIGVLPTSGWSDMWNGSERVARYEEFLSEGGDYDELGAGGKLVIFAQLREAFGWEAYRSFFQQYIDASPNELPDNNQEELDQWLVRFSDVVGLDLSSLFEAWDFGVSASAVQIVQGLPQWSMIEVLDNQTSLGSVSSDGGSRDFSVRLDSLAMDMGGRPLTFELDSASGNGTLTQNEGGTLSYVPNAAFRGTDSFTVSVSNDLGQSKQITLTVNVTGPVVANADSVETREGSAATINTDFLLANDVTNNVAGAEVLIAASPTNGSLVQVADGQRYQPNPGFVGQDHFTYQVLDGTSSLIRSGDTWRYLDDGSDQGTTWRGVAFDDDSWASGASQLGYGDGDESTVISFGGSSSNKHATTYFRKSLTLPAETEARDLTLRLLRDDAAAVYVDGVEVYRDTNLSRTARADTYATSSVDDEDAFVVESLPNLVLGSGEHVIAVEVHQSSRTSSDVSFDFELTGRYLSAPATVFIDVVANEPHGDFDSDGDVDIDDVETLCTALRNGESRQVLDLDSNGNVDHDDLTVMIRDILGTVFGDANLDGRVDALDLNIVGRNWTGEANPGWSGGDFNCDGQTDAIDLNVVGTNWLHGVPNEVQTERRAAMARQRAIGRRALPAGDDIDLAFGDESFLNRRTMGLVDGK